MDEEIKWHYCRACKGTGLDPGKNECKVCGGRGANWGFYTKDNTGRLVFMKMTPPSDFFPMSDEEGPCDGLEPDVTSWRRCPKCRGRRIVRDNDGAGRRCDLCNGSGEVYGRFEPSTDGSKRYVFVKKVSTELDARPLNALAALESPN